MLIEKENTKITHDIIQLLVSSRPDQNINLQTILSCN